jgi:uncharacterized protein
VTSTVPGLRIGVSDLRRHPGERRRIERSLPLDGVAISTARVPDGAEGTLDVVLESLSDGVTVNGVVRVPWVGPCRRCLEETGGTAEAEVHEVFSDHPVDGELLPFDGDAVDLGPVVHDAVVLALPLAPLCREDCPGPDPEHFPVATADSAPPPVDPRWSALAELRFDPEGTDPLE